MMRKRARNRTRTLRFLLAILGLVAGALALACNDSSVYSQATGDELLQVNLARHTSQVGDFGRDDMLRFISQWAYMPGPDAPAWTDSFAWARDPGAFARANTERYVGQWSYQPTGSGRQQDGYAWARDPLAYVSDMARFIRQWGYQPDTGTRQASDGFAWAREPGAYGRANMERYIVQWSYRPDGAALTWTDGYSWARGPMPSVHACAAPEVDGVADR